MKSFLSYTLLAALLLVGVSWSAEPIDPITVIKSKDKELKALLKDKKAKKTPERANKIKGLINGIFDFEELGKKSLGTTTYTKLTPAQQTKFIGSFKEMIENASLKKLDLYESDSTQYDAPEYNTQKNKVKITAHTFQKGQESVLEYHMHLQKDQWKAWDLVIDDLSTYRNYKEQFKRILETKKIEDLIKILQDKAKQSMKDYLKS